MEQQGYLKPLVRRCYLNFKNLRLLFWLPLLVVNVVLPALNFICYRANGVGDYLLVDINEKALLLLPFLSIWWTLFILQEYVEADGCETLYVCRRRLKLAEALCPFLLYLLNITLLYGVYIAVFPKQMPMEYARMLCICCFFFGLAYFLIYATKSITISLMVLLLYALGSALLVPQSPFFPLYKMQGSMRAELLWQFYLPLLACGGALLWLGLLFNKKSVPKA